MLKPFLVVLQDELRGATDPAPEIRALGHEVSEFSATGDWRSHLQALEDRMVTSAAHRPILFVSLDAARFVRQRCPNLRRGLLLNSERLKVHSWSGYLPQDLLLNGSFILLPYGAIQSRKAQIETLFGRRIFLRPDSSMKEFPGFCLDLDNLEQELSALTQIYRPDPALLCVIDKARSLPVHEYRFWLADGEILSCAPYAFGPQGQHPELQAPPCPENMLRTARRLADLLEVWENPVVADLVLDKKHIPRLVEINGFSTSGFYPGLKMGELLKAMDQILLG